MHPESYELMRQMLNEGPKQAGLSALDVGSLNVNGAFTPLVRAHGWSYTGLDMEAGSNVDVVVNDPFDYPYEDDTFDVVLSGSTMEHVTAVWKWIPELVRVLKPGGYLAIHTHWQFPEHRYPLDCWRIMPDGMAFLFNETGQLERYNIRIANSMDIVATAWKVAA